MCVHGMGNLPTGRRRLVLDFSDKRQKKKAGQAKDAWDDAQMGDASGARLDLHQFDAGHEGICDEWIDLTRHWNRVL